MGSTMKKFNSYLISMAVISLVGAVTDGMANSISFSTVAVYATFLMITDWARSFATLFIHTYNVTRKDEGRILLSSLLWSSGIGLSVWLCKVPVVSLFSLPAEQQETLLRLMDVFSLSLAAAVITDGVFEILKLQDKLKLYDVLRLFYYVIRFAGYYVASAKKDVIYALLGTFVANVVVCLVALATCRIRLKLPDRELLLAVKRYGVPVNIERVANQLCVVATGIFASRMGIHAYAVFSVCYAVNRRIEVITNAYGAVSMIEMPRDKPVRRQYLVARAMQKKVLPEVMAARVLLGAVYLMILHGEVPLSDCFPVIVFYIFPSTPLLIYETYKAVCLVSKSTSVLMLSGIIAGTSRVLLCAICYRFNFAVYLFGFIIPMKFVVYVVCEKYLLRRRGLLVDQHPDIVDRIPFG